ncbi:phosphomannomutase [Altericroceibacterium spongiae]|uniref:Phosphomannomutase n=1 Tax=Altericroceibacterium spongiae TaxID=2320269 RepID=A0A420E9H1_9SPHN|nr:phosphomannomutase [Altericroceibacterium spongiae]RKF15978.1 phosphomannomutase [Altericroceibacterium spongiae]
MEQQISVSELMAMSGVAFGTSGARGLVSAMTDLVCFTYSCAFLQHMEELGQFGPGTHVAISGDLRPSSPRIMAACAAAVRHMGGVVDNLGFIPSPALAAYGFERKIPSMMVTGSHIPDDRNGIKFNRADGEVLKSDEQAMKAQDVALPDIFDGKAMLRDIATLPDPVDASSAYIGRYLTFFEAGALKGLKLGVYEHSAVGRDILVAILEQLGAEVVRLGRSETFIPVDTEAVRPEDEALARNWASQYGLDAILSTDGDSDRPLLADETGRWLRGDVLGILCAHALRIEQVATPVSSNTALERSGLFTAVSRTRIGSPFVIEALNQFIEQGGTACGYEANGGFILGTPVMVDGRTLPALSTRDAVLPMLAVIVAARREGVSIGRLQAQLPSRCTFSDRIKEFPTEQSKALLAYLQCSDADQSLKRLSQTFGDLAGAAIAVDSTDGLRISFDSGNIIHLRPSGNAPELRCYSESETPQDAASINAKALALVRNLAFAH